MTKPWEETWTVVEGSDGRVWRAESGGEVDVECIGEEQLVLAAAAPDLYRAIEALQRVYFSRDCEYAHPKERDRAVEMAWAALRKARGER